MYSIQIILHVYLFSLFPVHKRFYLNRPKERFTLVEIKFRFYLIERKECFSQVKINVRFYLTRRNESFFQEVKIKTPENVPEQ